MYLIETFLLNILILNVVNLKISERHNMIGTGKLILKYIDYKITSKKKYKFYTEIYILKLF